MEIKIGIDYKEWKDLNTEERAEVEEAFINTEDRNESDKIAPKEIDLEDYYQDNAENFKFGACEHDWVSDGEPTLGCLGGCYKKPVKCSVCDLKADEVWMYSCIMRRDDGTTIEA